MGAAPEPHTKEPIMEEGITFVGQDAHKVAINVSVLFPGGRGAGDVGVHE